MSKHPTLSTLKAGMEGIVLKLDGGEQFRQKMHGLGIRKGMNLRIIQGSAEHPFLVDAAGTKVAIGWGMTQKIIVRI